MEYEIELKLLTNENAGDLIENTLLPTLTSKVTKSTLVLLNHYFDTPDRLLRKHDMGLRIRVNGKHCEQTLKTSGQSVGGLHQRPEYNVSLTNYHADKIESPDLTLFEPSAWPEHFDVPAADANLEIMFTTHFTREQYLLEDADSSIEMVWDRGEVTGGGMSLPICELELELKRGRPKALFELAKHIATLMPLSMGTQSKAARGYRLADKTELPNSQIPSPEAVEVGLLDQEGLTLLINKALSHFQLYSSRFQLKDSKTLNYSSAIQITKALYLLDCGLAKLYELTTCQALVDIQQQLSLLSSQWSEITINSSKHSDMSTQDSMQAMAFLSSERVINAQLDLVYLLLERTNESM